MAQAAGIVGTVLSFASTIMGGNAAAKQAKAEAAQLTTKAGQERAVTQRRMIAARREGELVESRSAALAAATGGGAGDVGVQNILSGIGAETETNVGNVLYEGEERAKGLEFQAANVLAKGKAAKRASRISALGQLAGSAVKTFGGFGGESTPDSGWKFSSGQMQGTDIGDSMPWLRG
jgi:hypothetical protein